MPGRVPRNRHRSARLGGHMSGAFVRAERFRALRVDRDVWEWCADWFDSSYYEVSPSENPEGPEGGAERVIRGGAYLCHVS
jgi:sulfatase modifying factor 1